MLKTQTMKIRKSRDENFLSEKNKWSRKLTTSYASNNLSNHPHSINQIIHVFLRFSPSHTSHPSRAENFFLFSFLAKRSHASSSWRKWMMETFGPHRRHSTFISIHVLSTKVFWQISLISEKEIMNFVREESDGGKRQKMRNRENVQKIRKNKFRLKLCSKIRFEHVQVREIKSWRHQKQQYQRICEKGDDWVRSDEEIMKNERKKISIDGSGKNVPSPDSWWKL